MKEISNKKAEGLYWLRHTASSTCLKLCEIVFHLPV